MDMLTKPIIMTAELGKADFAWADSLRRQYYPPERNQVAAHVTLFHHLPPLALGEIKQAIVSLAKAAPPPKAALDGLIHLGSGAAFQVHSPELLQMRMDMAEMFHGLLTAQDRQRPRLHITVQNKVAPHEAKALLDHLSGEFEPRPLSISGLALHYYMDGPWENIGHWPFRGL